MNDSDDDDDDDNDDNKNDNNNQDLYVCTTHHDKITKHALHQSLRSTIKVRRNMHSVIYSHVSASFI